MSTNGGLDITWNADRSYQTFSTRWPQKALQVFTTEQRGKDNSFNSENNDLKNLKHDHLNLLQLTIT